MNDDFPDPFYTDFDNIRIYYKDVDFSKPNPITGDPDPAYIWNNLSQSHKNQLVRGIYMGDMPKEHLEPFLKPGAIPENDSIVKEVLDTEFSGKPLPIKDMINDNISRPKIKPLTIEQINYFKKNNPIQQDNSIENTNSANPYVKRVARSGNQDPNLLNMPKTRKPFKPPKKQTNTNSSEDLKQLPPSLTSSSNQDGGGGTVKVMGPKDKSAPFSYDSQTIDKVNIFLRPFYAVWNSLQCYITGRDMLLDSSHLLTYWIIVIMAIVTLILAISVIIYLLYKFRIGDFQASRNYNPENNARPSNFSNIPISPLNDKKKRERAYGSDPNIGKG